MLGRGTSFLGSALAAACLFGVGAICVAQQSPIASGLIPEQDQRQIIAQLQSGDASSQRAGVERLHAISPLQLALSAKEFFPKLIDAGAISEIEDLATAAILARPADVAAVEAAQHARAQAAIALKDYPNALIQAKSYYDVCALEETGEAIRLLLDSLEKSGKHDDARAFKAIQTTTHATSTSAPASILNSVHVDDAPYATTLNQLRSKKGARGTYSYASLMSQGNILLLEDQPGDARKAFEDACKEATRNAKQLREAVEGVARAIRAQSEDPSAANAFILQLRDKNIEASAPLMGTADISAQQFADVARQTELAEPRMRLAPPLEDQRAEEDANIPNPPIGIETDVETAKHPEMIEMLSPTHFVVKLIDVPPQWFIIKLEGVADKTVRIDFVDTATPLQYWMTLNPVFAETDSLEASDLYSFSKPTSDRGSVAWNGAELPSTDGQRWRFMPNVWESSTNTVSAVEHFSSKTAFVAMRVPYLPSLNKSYLSGLSSTGSVKIETVGTTEDGQPLLMARIGTDDQNEIKRKPCVLIYAGEHSDEPDPMWVARDAIAYLLSDAEGAHRALERATFLVIPQLDPQATSQGLHAAITQGFMPTRESKASAAYANWFKNWVIDKGYRVDLVLDLHNIQSAEHSNISCALLEGSGDRGAVSLAFHSALVTSMRQANIGVEDRPWTHGWSPDRLGGWLSHHYGALCLTYEINSQAPDRHLSLYDLSRLSQTMVDTVSEFLVTQDGARLIQDAGLLRDARLKLWSDQKAKISDPNDAIKAEAYLDRSAGALPVTGQELLGESVLP